MFETSLGQVAVQHLQRDELLEAGGALHAGLEHLGHPAPGDAFDQFVVTVLLDRHRLNPS